MPDVFYYEPVPGDGGPTEAGWYAWYGLPRPDGPWSAPELVAGPFETEEEAWLV